MLTCDPKVWLAVLALGTGLNVIAQGHLSLVRTPGGGIQPQATVDGTGVVHLIYYQGEPSGGDLFYVKRPPGHSEFSKPLRVNAQKGSAMAMGTIRGAQLAIGKNGRVHVAWDGMGSGAVRVSISGKEVAPLLSTRVNDEGTAFEPERNLITFAAGLDGGSSVAADPQGNVYVTWHAPQPGNTNEEAGRAIFIARSEDEGRTFKSETLATSKATGACPCCGMRAFADRSGAVYILFRSARDELNRDALLLVAPKPGAEFQIALTDKWRVSTCPMSSATLTETKEGALAAWETAGQVYCATVNSQNLKVSPPICPPGEVVRKHPVAVSNQRGETLLVWTEGTAWGQGGSVAWQVYSKEGKLLAEKGHAEGVPAWSLATACATTDGNFLIVY